MTPRDVMILGFVAVFGAMVVVDLVSRHRGRGPDPLTTALTAAMRTPVGRAVVLGWWLWIGYHFLAR
jgi:hypothetical protein